MQTEETVIVVISAAGLIAGPLLFVMAPFMPRPGYGPCPLCGAMMYQMFGPGEGGYLVCPRCVAYARTEGDKLSLVPTNIVSESPVFAAALPWDDITGEPGKTIAFSAQDVVMDKLNDLITRKDGIRVIDKWPPACCVCGSSSSRHEDLALQVSIKGRALDTHATVVARSVPYCGKHKDGIAFGRVDFATSLFEDATSFCIKFRSHAYREAFRKLNPHKFDNQSDEPLKIRLERG
ncbi:MAG: hypothetical protein ABL973_18960 [Micropepsaceae bacterium]